MGAKQQLLGLADDRLPPIMIFGPSRWYAVASSRAGDEAVGGDAASPLAHTLPRGWAANFPPSIPQAKQAPRAAGRFSASREV